MTTKLKAALAEKFLSQLGNVVTEYHPALGEYSADFDMQVEIKQGPMLASAWVYGQTEEEAKLELFHKLRDLPEGQTIVVDAMHRENRKHWRWDSQRLEFVEAPR